MLLMSFPVMFRSVARRGIPQSPPGTPILDRDGTPILDRDGTEILSRLIPLGFLAGAWEAVKGALGSFSFSSLRWAVTTAARPGTRLQAHQIIGQLSLRRSF